MKILLAVTGSISCYKSIELCRELTKEGHQVKVILSKGAEQFLKPDLFQYLGATETFLCSDDFNLQKNNSKVLHIELAKWCERIVVCPLSANSLAKLAAGMADDLLSSVFLAREDKPALLIPAMNPKMYSNDLVQSNLKRLESLTNLFIHPPEAGEMVCGDIGLGKLPSIERIKAVVTTLSFDFIDKTVLITTGATKAMIDPVRYVTNPSNGVTGYYLAQTYLSKGYKVIVVAGEEALNELNFFTSIPQYTLIRVQTTEQMQEKVDEYIHTANLYISAAAICDMQFNQKLSKLKKENFENNLNFQPAPDILAEVLANRKANQIIVGFAAETNLDSNLFLKKWQKKPVDLLIGNTVSNGLNPMGFRSQEGHYQFILHGKFLDPVRMSKQDLSNEIFRLTNEALNENH